MAKQENGVVGRAREVHGGVRKEIKGSDGKGKAKEGQTKLSKARDKSCKQVKAGDGHARQ